MTDFDTAGGPGTLDELRRSYRNVRAPADTTATAIARFQEKTRRPQRWQPALAAAALVLAVVTIPAVFDEHGSDTTLTLPARDYPMPSLTAISVPRPDRLDIPRPSARVMRPQLNSEIPWNAQ